ncbi:MAG: hypothetical protein ACYCOR_17535 [Acidobacteriaceae bacterium]
MAAGKQQKKPTEIFNPEEIEEYYDFSADHVAQIRKMRQAVRREIEKIGDLADYDVRKIVGQKAASPESVPEAKRPSSQRQAALNFDDSPGEHP